MTAVELDPDRRARLLRLAEARHRTPAGLMQEAIAQFICREEALERLRDDAEAAWRDFRTDGLHSTAAEVDAWLARLEAGEEVDPPARHR